MSFFSWIDGLVSGVYDAIKGWVKDFLNSAIGQILTTVTDFVRNIIDNGLKGIAWLIHQATVLIEEAKFHLSQGLQKLYNTTLGFWAILGATIVGILVLPGAVAWAIKAAQATKLYATIIKLLGDVKSWQGWQAVNIAIEANRIAIVLFQNWRDIWQGIYADVETIAGDIGLGLGALAAVTTASKAILTTIYNLVGGTELSSETAALGQMQGWLAGLSNQFDKYAQNPQAIWNDLWANVIVPAQGQIRDYAANILTQINGINNKILELEKLPSQFVTYQDSVQKLLGIQLSASESKIEKQVLKQVNSIINGYNANIASQIDSINKALAPLETAIQQHDKQLAANSKALATLQNPSVSIPNTLTTEYLTGVLGGDTALVVGYLASNQFSLDTKTLIDYMLKGTELNMGLITQEQFAEYVDSQAQFGIPVVNPFAV